MQIGEIIRKNRKSKNMTQEDVARYLGVTAPAVNKWENGNSMPDIMLLAPIARLLEVSLDDLLSFREDLTSEEINSFVREADERLKNESYETVFQWAKDRIEEYPNCDQLIWQLALIFDVRRLTAEIPDPDQYDDFIRECYIRVLESRDQQLRNRAADSLYSFHFRKNQYKEAEEYLKYFSLENPERKRKLADICSRTGRKEEAYKAYEELLFSGYQMTAMILQSILMLTLEDKNMEKAHFLVKKQGEMARAFEMGEYHATASGLELAVMEKNIGKSVEIMEIMLGNIDKMMGFCHSPLFEHMSFKPVDETFFAELKRRLSENFGDEETYGFLKEDVRWQRLVKSGESRK